MFFDYHEIILFFRKEQLPIQFDISIKCKKQIDFEKVRNIFKECEILRYLDHPNIIKVYGFFYGDKVNKPAILLEYCISNLNDRISSLDDINLVAIIYEICSAMAYIHDKKIIYRDLKPKNILINLSKHVKLCDFGISKVINATETSLTNAGGTLLYMAPELFQPNMKYNEKIDVYAFGAVAYFVLTKGEYPTFYGFGNLRKAQIPKSINKVSKSLIKNCWHVNPDERPSFSQIIEYIKNEKFLMIDGVDDKIPSLKQHLGIE